MISILSFIVFSISSAKESCITSTCHKEMKGFKYTHAPLSEGCDACHEEAKKHIFKLTARGNELCSICHEKEVKKFIHPPVEDDCLNCHNPHGSGYKHLLKKAQKNLCYGCHSDIKNKIKGYFFKHSPIKQGRCSGCHESHGSDYKKMLKTPLDRLCFSCHKKMKLHIDKSKYVHSALQEGCIICHKPHASDNPKLLSAYFPPFFYTPFSSSTYKLCFLCHDSEPFEDPDAYNATNFRNSNINLHWLHVNKKKGRNCEACHDVHAAKQPKLIKTKVAFCSIWAYPIEYEVTEKGGKCTPGCHLPRYYSR